MNIAQNTIHRENRELLFAYCSSFWFHTLLNFQFTVSNVRISQHMPLINVSWVVKSSTLAIQLKVILYPNAVQTVNAANPERLLRSIAPTPNVRKYLKNTIQSAYRYMMIRNTAAVLPKYAVTIFTILYFFQAFYLFLMSFYFVSIIDEAKIRSLNTCVVDGRTYHIGERIYPDNSCYECLCANGYNNATSPAENPNCSKVNCGIELKMNKLREGCVPVYYKTPICCPIEYKCRKFYLSKVWFFDLINSFFCWFL